MDDEHAGQRPGTLREYTQLFVAVLALFVVGTAFEESPEAVLLQTVVAGAALMLALRVGPAHRRTQVIALVLVILAILTAVAALFAENETAVPGITLLINGILVACGPIAVFGAVRTHNFVSLRTVLGAVTVYIMLGLFFATLYRSFNRFDSDSFVAANGVLDPAALQYLSLITLTTVGFGDIVAKSDIARTAVSLEALIGQIYLVTIVALVVANIGHERQRRNPKS